MAMKLEELFFWLPWLCTLKMNGLKPVPPFYTCYSDYIALEVIHDTFPIHDVYQVGQQLQSCFHQEVKPSHSPYHSAMNCDLESLT